MSRFTDAVLKLPRRLAYPGSRKYWERRYASGGHSGSGSGGILAQYKADILNGLVLEYNVASVLEFGCGDGRQLARLRLPDYTGLDIAPSAIRRCRHLHAEDPGLKFDLYEPARFDPSTLKADLTLSMEVIFHLTEDSLYEYHIRHLFAAARRIVVVFSSDIPDTTGGVYPHFKPRNFTSDIPGWAPGWILTRHIPNPHREISSSDFFIFERQDP